MKKLFLIPLMAMLCAVMAWADPVTTLAELQAALNAGGEVTLGASINAGATAVTFSSGTAILDLGEYTLSSTISASGQTTKGGLVISGGSLTIKGSGSITAANGNAIYMSAGALTIKSGSFSGANEGIFATAGTITVDGGTLHGGDNAIWSRGDAITINGGTLTGDWGAIQADNNVILNITGGNITGADQDVYMNAWSSIANPSPSCSISGGTFNGNGIIVGSGNLVVIGGTFAVNPVSYLDVSSYVAILEDDKYVVSALAADVVAYNQTQCITHTSLADAVAAASASDVIYLYKNDESAVTVAKIITIATNGHTTNLSAGAGYNRADMGQNVVFTDNAIAAFLMADGTASLTVSEDANIASAGAIHVNGTKTLTINEGVTVTYKRQGSDGNIVVDKDAKLTVLGSGTFAPQMHSQTNTVNGFTVETSTTASNQVGNRAIDVAVGGELVVGVKDDPNNCPHFITSSIARGSAVSVDGKATFNNANIQAACASIWNYGSVIINSGEYVSVATAQNGINGGWYSYNLRNDAGSNLVINDGHFVGTQGSVAVYAGATADINGGYFETVHGYNYITGAANEKDHHYALYVATEAIVNVYNGYFKVATPSAGGGKVILSGNDDAYNTYGVINIYGGYFQRKADVQDKKNGESSYPASVPTTSQWYSSFGSLAPLPAGYEYYETDDAEYPYGVRAVEGKEADAIDPAQQAAQEADPTYTIPWQQATTWAADEVPVENTIVTIPVDATVTVSKDEEVKDAVADQVYVAQGATLKVEEGTTLTVGDGGMNIGNGGQIVVEAGATVKIGSAGIITTEEEALVIESTETKQGVLLYDPAVEENTQPKGTVKLYTRSKMNDKATWEYTYQRFALPVYNNSNYTLTNNFSEAEHGYYDEEEKSYGFESYFFEWNGSAWTTTTRGALQPFAGYQLANNSKNGGVTYTFTGNLIGNGDGEYEFVSNGYDFFGNSYTAPINIQKLLEGFQANTPGVEVSVWVYDPEVKNWGLINLDALADGFTSQTEIPSMEGFLLNLRSGSSATAGVSYASAIWGPLMGGGSPAPARTSSAIDNSVVITVAAQDMADRLTLVEKETSDASFENGSDATKFMNPSGLNIYAETAAGTLSRVSTNNLDGTLISFNSIAEEQYTLSFSNVNGSDYVLRDNANGTIIELQNGSTYSFYQVANTTATGRFELVSARKIATGIDNTITAASTKGIYTVLGQYVGETTMLNALPAGVYVVDGVKVVK